MKGTLRYLRLEGGTISGYVLVDGTLHGFAVPAHRAIEPGVGVERAVLEAALAAVRLGRQAAAIPAALQTLEAREVLIPDEPESVTWVLEPDGTLSGRLPTSVVALRLTVDGHDHGLVYGNRYRTFHVQLPASGSVSIAAVGADGTLGQEQDVERQPIEGVTA